MKTMLLAAALSSCLNASAQGKCHLTANETAARMGVGWNLGNTLEAGGGAECLFTNKGGLGAETSWQGTRTTQALIDFVRDQGFGSIRIPCAWVMGHISDPANYTIDRRWMARVKQVVNYCIKDSLYVVLNDHWDGGWLESKASMKATGAEKEKKKAVLHAIWTQIAEEFKDYDHHLLFAGLNEPDANEDNNAAATKAMVDNLKEYEQVFIDAVRATGGNNAERVLVVQAPCTSIELACKYYKDMRRGTLFNDPAKDRLMIEVHYYSPWQFWGMDHDEAWGNCFYYWGKDNHVAGSAHNPNWDCEEADMAKQLKTMYVNFSKYNIPVLIGELGANWRNLSGMAGESQEKHNASIALYYRLVHEYALQYNMVPMAWDTNYPNYGMTIIDRNTPSIYNTIMMDAIKGAVVATGMKEVKADEVESGRFADRCFNLCGQLVNPTKVNHGIVICNGKKYVKTAAQKY